MKGRSVGGAMAGQVRCTESKVKKKTDKIGSFGRDEQRSGGEEGLTSAWGSV